MATTFTERVREIIKQIPQGKVTTYGIIAAGAGNGSGARQVARILHSSSKTHGLPWHRVVNRAGKISLAPGRGYEMQRDLLLSEGIIFTVNDVIDLDQFLWLPGEKCELS